MSNTRAPSMFDVASRSGVSHQTVSRVLNNHENVSPKTRTKVLEAMAELGYRPNLAARALVTGKTETIGVLSHDTSQYGPASTLLAVQASARAKGYKTVIYSLQDENPDSIIDGIYELRRDGVDGIVLIAPLLTSTEKIEKSLEGFPAVLIESDVSSKFPSVTVDQTQGSYELTKHLIEMGHKVIAHISGPRGWYESDNRRKGWKKALDENKLSSKFTFEGDWSAKSGYDATTQLIKNKEITAIVAGNDQMAVGALKALAENGLEVPRQISVTGFDDIPEAPYLTPALTTIRQDFYQVGEHALTLLLGNIDGKKSAKSVVVKPELLLRESTGRLKSSRKS